MDNKPQTPNIELPKPQIEGQGLDMGEVIASSPETNVQPAAPSVSQANDAVAQAVADTSALPVIPYQDATDDQSSGSSGAPVIADDVDVIEKEWVEKAKAIVAKTKTDPHAQSHEITHFKYDYMKKRYGKEIKLPDEKSED